MDNSTDSSTSVGGGESTSESGTTTNSSDGDVNATATEYWYSHYESFTIDSSSTNEISTAGQLAYLAYMVNSGNTYSGYVFQLTTDLDMSAYYWVPIGGHNTTCSTYSTSYKFAGEFDGNSHTISGLDTSYADTTSDVGSYMGLFGYIFGSSSLYASVHDVGIADSTIEGYRYVGGIAGSASYVNFSGCYNISSIEVTSFVGGIVGYAWGYVNFENCYNTGNVTGTGSRVGGIVGYVYIMPTFSKCYNVGSVTGNSYIGGIIGDTCWGGTISNCYNIGNVEASSKYVGGILGIDEGYEGSCLKTYNCYNAGSVIGESYVGGITGCSITCSYICNCFNVGDVSGSSYAGGVVGYNTKYSGVSQVDPPVVDVEDDTGIDVDVLIIDITDDFEEELVTIQTETTGIYYCYYGGNCSEMGGLEGTDYSDVADYLEDIATLAKTESWFTDSSYWNSTYAWDFDSIWLIDASYNDGYPILLWQWDNPYLYDEDGNYWYFEDGYTPQSYYGTETPDGVDEDSPTAAYTIRLSTTSWTQVEIFSGTDDDYAYVTIYSGSNVEVASAWFVVEPIVWIVAYGSATPTSVTSAVTAQIVTAGYVCSNAGTSFSWAMSSVLGMSVETLESYLDLSFASVGDFEYDSFSGSLSQLAVTDNATTLSSKIAVSSVDEIDSLGGSYASTCTDFVAFLLSGGASTDGDSYSADYWTRDLAATLDSNSTYGEYTSVAQLNNGVYVTKDGTLSNAKLKTCMGARLTMSIG